jgi:hypothetical protein
MDQHVSIPEADRRRGLAFVSIAVACVGFVLSVQLGNAVSSCIPRSSPPKRPIQFGQFLDRMKETNERTFGIGRLDCCIMKKR